MRGTSTLYILNTHIFFIWVFAVSKAAWHNKETNKLSDFLKSLEGKPSQEYVSRGGSPEYPVPPTLPHHARATSLVCSSIVGSFRVRTIHYRLDGMTPPLKISHALVPGHREIKLVRTWKFLPCRLAFKVTGGSMQSTEGTRDQR